METKIGEVKGYTIFYNSQDKQFVLHNSNGDEVGSGKTQDEVEATADKLSKQAYKFPIPALDVSQLRVYAGGVTSVNPSDKSFYFVYDDKTHGHHQKMRMHYSRVFEATEANKEIATKVGERRKELDRIEGEIEALIAQLEKPMNLTYFGLKDQW